MAGFNLKDYEPVEARLQRYIKTYPDFRVTTRIEHQDENRIVIRATIYKNQEEQSQKLPHATGIAEETRGEGYVNKTSHVENCETSALGRALANAGFSGNKNGQRASRQEMEKVQKLEEKEPQSEGEKNQDKCEICGTTNQFHRKDCPNG